MQIHTILDHLNLTNIYLLCENGQAIAVDPCSFDSVNCYIQKNELALSHLLLTHEHYDHIRGADGLRARYGCTMISSKACSDRLEDPHTNFSAYAEQFEEFKKYKSPEKVEAFSCRKSDIAFEQALWLHWQGHTLKLFETPGHSKGSISILVDEKLLFSGDSLLSEEHTILGFPGGSKKDYNGITLPLYQRLSPEVVVYPGHGDGFLLGEQLSKLGRPMRLDH